jgi:hypothetical protein
MSAFVSSTDINSVRQLLSLLLQESKDKEMNVQIKFSFFQMHGRNNKSVYQL